MHPTSPKDTWSETKHASVTTATYVFTGVYYVSFFDSFDHTEDEQFEAVTFSLKQ